jgi:long-chain acyl-CoA synthetase
MPGMIHSGVRTTSGTALARRAAQAASGLQSIGVGPGGAIALLMRNDFAMVEAAFAAAQIGAFSIPINWHFGPREVAHIVADSGATVLVVHADLYPAVAEAIPAHVRVLVAPTPPEIAAAYAIAASACEAAPGRTAWNEWLSAFPESTLARGEAASNTIIYTSGTTGKPKGVKRMASPASAARAAAAIASLFDLRTDARAAITGPMYHSALNGYGLGMIGKGADVWLMPRFDAETLLQMIEQHRLTHLHLVPIMFARLLKLPDAVRRKYDVTSLQNVVHAAAPCPPEVKRRMIDWWGPIIGEYFGSTEMRAIASCTAEQWLAHPGTVGRILPETTIKIFDETGQQLAPGEIGEIYARNETSEDFSYTGDPAKRAAIERDGLITSGDVGYLDKEGFLFLCDRRNDMINSGGVNIYPAEIEACLIELDGVQDCAVFGVPDPDYGESVAAAIQLKPGASLAVETVQNFVRDRLARYKAPKVVEFVLELPREDSGKVFKQRLRAPYWESAGRKI